ncbi:MAG: Rrf2 family transcriptional regulator [Bryobacterales bacterium]|nr:Rrf2 family transcriptional regulator [Bryobacterales bacterium]
MQLSLHADYALRVLLYLGTHPGQVISTQRVSAAYGISRNHLVRVVQTLAEHGYVRVTPGRSGGAVLARDPGRIRLGDVVRDAEPSLRLVECFDETTNTCPIVSACTLKRRLYEALEAFLAELNRHTLADLLDGPKRRSLAALFVQITVPATR